MFFIFIKVRIVFILFLCLVLFFYVIVLVLFNVMFEFKWDFFIWFSTLVFKFVLFIEFGFDFLVILFINVL